MQLGDHLGFAGVILAVAGVGITILWPEKRWIGVVCLAVAGLLGVCWGAMAYWSWKHPSLEVLAPQNVNAPQINPPRIAPPQHQEAPKQPPLPSNQPTSKRKIYKAPTPQPVIEELPPTGNLRERTEDLIREISNDVSFRHQYLFPNGEDHLSGPKYIDTWGEFVNGNGDKFAAVYLPKVESLRGEYASFHIRNNDLDDFLETEDKDKAAQMTTDPHRARMPWMAPNDFNKLFAELRYLESKLPSQ